MTVRETVASNRPNVEGKAAANAGVAGRTRIRIDGPM
jgi:hypothetical protein